MLLPAEMVPGPASVPPAMVKPSLVVRLPARSTVPPVSWSEPVPTRDVPSATVKVPPPRVIAPVRVSVPENAPPSARSSVPLRSFTVPPALVTGNEIKDVPVPADFSRVPELVKDTPVYRP